MPELTATPNLTALFGKAVLTGFTRRGTRLPDTVYEQPNVSVDRTHLARYDRVCEFRLTDELPVTYPHVLAFPLQVKLMTDPGFPFPLIGSVHLANRIIRIRPLRVDERLTLRVHVENLRDHARGRQFDMISEVLVAGEPVWTGVSTYLRRGGGSGAEKARERVEPPEPTAVWRVPGNIGRRYAEVSGDRNPIHLHPLAARLFGFPRAIAHGMWTKARCLAAFEGRLPEAYTVDVRFKLPVLLPARTGFAASTVDQGWGFELFDARTGRPHLAGTVTPGA
ncbi:MAG TPA: MaoC/PaaZ C-terminal domain-containing protein [Actinophytocola sp.]|uniref:MaoC/PaaZ C-terminal domain-containing protein n=1 Tax=Actinophytocola sp. TaxID=1872138 RepID=UPI002DDD65BD|nr:MaoC/PaaZ C-terminal domain-containing protein [Actinophytocola sp.]HEV2784663.1 MaoC/PaaZ C-terminal domain-containing protein [Actinophytocola sp.]